MGLCLEGKRIIITGGTSGIGQASVIDVAKAGARVAFCGIGEEGAEETKEAVRKAGSEPFFRSLDLCDLSTARRFTHDAIAFLGGLDGLVNNAGQNFFHGVATSSYDQIASCFSLNFFSAWAVSQEAYPALKAAGGGVIVFMSSIYAQRVLPGIFPYNVSKAALEALTKSIAVEWGPDNIQVVAIAPAMVLTPMSDLYFQKTKDPAAARKNMEESYPLRRAGRPEDISSLVVYLLSGASRFINGSVIPVNGGAEAQLRVGHLGTITR
jgi:NAD(P)-dependent dehydrogenase (short-subunit alcohol dehydrogenase family)